MRIDNSNANKIHTENENTQWYLIVKLTPKFNIMYIEN